MVSLNEIAEGCLQVSQMRQKNGSRIDEDVLKHCAGEVAEAIIAREKLKRVNKETHPHAYELMKGRYAEEIMDICICSLVASAELEIDVETALKKKFAVNEKRALGLGDKL